MGDTIAFQAEVTPAMNAVLAAGLEVSSLHNHMIGEKPVFYFAYFWSKGSRDGLAKRLWTAIKTLKEATA